MAFYAESGFKRQALFAAPAAIRSTILILLAAGANNPLEVSAILQAYSHINVCFPHTRRRTVGYVCGKEAPIPGNTHS